MAKLGVAGNRLSVGPWSIPLSRSASRKNDIKKLSINTSKSASPGAIEKVRTLAPISEHARTSISNGAVQPNGTARPSTGKPSTSSLVELAAIITKETEKLDRYLQESGSPMPGFDVDSPMEFPKLPDEIERSREEVLRATKELGDLVTGPKEGVRWMAWDVSFSPITPKFISMTS